MSYFEIKTIKGHDYLYLRQSIRIGNRVVHKHVAYLGRVDAGRITGSSGGSQTVTQAKREYQPKPKVTPEEKEPKKKTKLPTVKAGIGKGPGREKIDRDQGKLLRKKKKKLKKFLRKKKIKKSEGEPEKEFKFLPWD